MSFWKKLKKIKVGSIAKKALKFVPGGNYISQGVGVLEGVIKSVSEKKPKTTVTTTAMQTDPLLANEQTKKSNTILYVVIAVGMFFILPKLMKG